MSGASEPFPVPPTALREATLPRPLMAFLYLIPMMLLFYALLIRPQRRQMAAHQALVASLSERDEVITVGGIYGTVLRLDDAIVELEIAPGTSVRVARTAISRRVPDRAT